MAGNRTCLVLQSVSETDFWTPLGEDYVLYKKVFNPAEDSYLLQMQMQEFNSHREENKHFVLTNPKGELDEINIPYCFLEITPLNFTCALQFSEQAPTSDLSQKCPGTTTIFAMRSKDELPSVVVIGRQNKRCGMVLDSRHLSVSKVHALIRHQYGLSTHQEEAILSDEFSIQDQGSRNGTFIDSNRLSEAQQKSPPHKLSSGSLLSIGDSHFRVWILPLDFVFTLVPPLYTIQ